MKDTLFSETIRYWSKMSKEEKRKALQKLEYENSLNQDRRPREIVFEKQSGCYGSYNLICPDTLFVNDEYLNDRPACIYVDTTYHEGVHSLIHDYIRKNAILYTIGNFSKEKFINNKSAMSMASLDGLFNAENNFILDYEERFVRRETCLYLLSNFLNACENERDCKVFLDNYYQAYSGILTIDQEYQTLSELIKKDFEKYYNLLYSCDKMSDSELLQLPNPCNSIPFDMRIRVAKRMKEEFYDKNHENAKIKNITEEQAKFLINFLKDNLKLLKKRENNIYPILDRWEAETAFENNFIHFAKTFDLN